MSCSSPTSSRPRSPPRRSSPPAVSSANRACSPPSSSRTSSRSASVASIWRRGRPASLFGNLLLAEGVLVFVSSLSGASSPALYLIGMLGVWAAALGATWLLLAFPGSRLGRSGLDRHGDRRRHLPGRRAPAAARVPQGGRAHRSPQLRRRVPGQPGTRCQFAECRRDLPPRRGRAPADLGRRAAPVPRDSLPRGRATHGGACFFPVFLSAAPFVVAFALNAALFDLAGVQPTDTARAIFAGTRILVPLGFVAGLLFARAYAGEALAFMARKLVGRPIDRRRRAARTARARRPAGQAALLAAAERAVRRPARDRVRSRSGVREDHLACVRARRGQGSRDRPRRRAERRSRARRGRRSRLAPGARESPPANTICSTPWTRCARRSGGSWEPHRRNGARSSGISMTACSRSSWRCGSSSSSPATSPTTARSTAGSPELASELRRCARRPPVDRARHLSAAPRRRRPRRRAPRGRAPLGRPARPRTRGRRAAVRGPRDRHLLLLPRGAAERRQARRRRVPRPGCGCGETETSVRFSVSDDGVGFVPRNPAVKGAGSRT